MNKRQKKKAYKKKYGVNPTNDVKAVCEVLKRFPEIMEQLNLAIKETLKAVSEFLVENKETLQKWAEETNPTASPMSETLRSE